MNRGKTRGKIAARLAAMLVKKERVNAEILAEMTRPAPCGLRLQEMKRRRLALKDAVRRLEFGTFDRAAA